MLTEEPPLIKNENLRSVTNLIYNIPERVQQSSVSQ